MNVRRVWEFVKVGLIWIVTAIPLAFGYLIGLIVKIFRIAWAAAVEGYYAGSKLT
jgi:hypothetical protein